MLGEVPWPPVKETERAARLPVSGRLSGRARTHVPDIRVVGAPIANRILTVSSRERSLNIASASSLSPSRVPRKVIILAADKSSWCVRSSTEVFWGAPQPVRSKVQPVRSTNQTATMRRPGRVSTIHIRTGTSERAISYLPI
jgi:hypothetical protein